MEEHKKRVLVLIGIILVIISLIAIILSMLFKDEKENNPSTPGNNPNSYIISKEIEELKDEDTFFTLQNSINSYYNLLSNKNTNELLKILDNDYKNSKNINNGNIYNVINADYETVSYIAKSIYYNPNSSITYYFINGYLTNLTMMEDDYDYYKNVNFLIIVDEKTKYYNLLPLDNNIDIERFARTYNITKKDITSEKILSSYTMSEKNKLVVYLTEFLDLMVYDNERAYNMLDDETKKRYSSREDFENQLMDIYNKLSTSVFGFSVKEIDGEKVYSILDDNQNKITIYEKNIMNYKISF